MTEDMVEPSAADAPQGQHPTPSKANPAAWRLALITSLSLLIVGVALTVPGEVSRWYFAAALEYDTSEQPLQARESLAKAISWNPRDPQLYVQRARWHKDAKQFEQALDDCQHAIELQPYDFSGYQARIEVRHAQGKHREAVEDCDRVVELYEKSPQMWSHYWTPDGWQLVWPYNGRAYAKALANVDLEAALQDIERSIAKHKALPSLLDTRAFVYYRMGEFEKGLEDMNKALEAVEKSLEEDYSDDRRGWPSARKKEIAARESKEKAAVLFYHRMLLHGALENTELADKDRAKVIELGAHPDPSLY